MRFRIVCCEAIADEYLRISNGVLWRLGRPFFNMDREITPAVKRDFLLAVFRFVNWLKHFLVMIFYSFIGYFVMCLMSSFLCRISSFETASIYIYSRKMKKRNPLNGTSCRSPCGRIGCISTRTIHACIKSIFFAINTKGNPLHRACIYWPQNDSHDSFKTTMIKQRGQWNVRWYIYIHTCTLFLLDRPIIELCRTNMFVFIYINEAAVTTWIQYTMPITIRLYHDCLSPASRLLTRINFNRGMDK